MDSIKFFGKERDVMTKLIIVTCIFFIPGNEDGF